MFADLFSKDSYRAFAILWSLLQIPHVLVPSDRALVPSGSTFAVPGGPPPGVSAVLPPAPATESSPLPYYVPALSPGNYAQSLFVDLFTDPASLPKLVTTLAGDLYGPGTRHPDVQLYTPTVPPILQERAKTVRLAAVERALSEVTRVPGGPPPPPQGGAPPFAGGPPPPQPGSWAPPTH